ncbi:MAG: ATP-binding protein, partial [Acidimicrobiales bacterium]
LTEPAFVGRATELAALGLALERTRQGRGGLVLAEAESGGGKTRLLDELAEQAERRGAWVLRGQGVDHAGHRPFQLLGGLVDAVEAADDAVVRRLQEALGDRADAVVGALPELAGILSGADLDLPEAHGETRSLLALPIFLDALGTPDRPALVLLDDCQWADGLTIRLLGAWQQHARTSGRHVLVVATFRSEEVDASHPLRSLDLADSIELRPLSQSEAEDLAESMAGPLPPEVHATLTELAEGSPFMTAAVLRGMVECGALVDSPSGWSVEEAALADVQTSRRAALFLVRRLELLSPAALCLLTAGAVLGKEFDLSLAVALSGQGPAEVVPALEDARRRRILWVADAEGRCQFLHDKLRETLLDRLSDRDRTYLHGRAAERIEAIDPGRSFDLAYHFDAAGEPDRCLPHALAAAEHARRQHNLEIAEAHYRMALRSAEGAGAGLRGRLAEGLADVLTLRGSYGEAEEQFELAQGLTNEAVARAALQAKVGDVAFRRGEHRKARERLEG